MIDQAVVSEELLYLDDLHVGRRFKSGTHALDERQIKEFARAFDPQVFHLDEQAARRTVFAGLVALTGWMSWERVTLLSGSSTTAGMPAAAQ